MAKTVLGLFETFRDAANAVQALIDANFLREDIGLLLPDAAREYTSTTSSVEGDSVVAGVGMGGVLGGLTGLVVGVGALSIPAVGLVIAAGPLATTLAGAALGAAGGGLVGALNELGASHVEAKHYAEGIRQGGTLITVRIDESRVAQAMEILQCHGAVDIDEHFLWQGSAREINSDRVRREGALDPMRDLDDGRVSLERRTKIEPPPRSDGSREKP